MKKFLHISLLSGLCASLFIPFIVINDLFFPFITGKGFAFRILVEVLAVIWIILALLDPVYRPRKSWIIYSLSAFVGVIALADIFGVNFYRSFWSNFERMEGLVLLLHLYVYTLMLCTVLQTERWWKYFFNISLGASAILVLFYALPQLHGDATIHQSSNRIDASLGNATYLAAYLLMHAFIAFFLYMRTTKMYERVLYALAIVLHIYVMYYTQTRGALLGLVGGLVIVAVLIGLFERERKVVRYVAWGGLGLIVALILGFLLIKDSAFVQQSPTLIRFAQISLSENFLKSQGRYYVWPMAIKGFQERPILGWGQENFNYVFNKNYDPGMWGQEQWFDRTHNVILDWLVAGGILGLLAYLSIFFSTLYYVWRGKTNSFSITDKAIITGFIAAYFIQNFFVFDNLTSYMLFLMIVAYVYTVRTLPDAPHLFPQKTMSVSPRLYVVMSVLIVGLAGVVYMVNIKPIQANMALLQAVAPEASGQPNYINDLASFKKSIGYNTFGTPEAREHLVLLSQRINDPAIPEDVRRAVFEFAATEMRKQIDTNAEPDARYYLFIGSLLSRYGLLDQALVDLQKALQLSPNKQSILIEIGNIYLTQKKFTEALEVYKQAFDLAPAFIQARLSYALGATEAGETKLAQELLAQVDINQILFDERALSLFVQARQFDTAIQILTKRIEADPQNPQYRLSLAAAYLQKNERGKAVQALQDFIALDPVKYKAQGEYYIKEIQAGRNP